MASCGGGGVPFDELPAAAEQEDETEDMETSEDLDEKLSTLLAPEEDGGQDVPQPPEPGRQSNRILVTLGRIFGGIFVFYGNSSSSIFGPIC